MPSSLSSPSRSRSLISVALLGLGASLTLGAGCGGGDGACGTNGASDDGLLASAGGVVLTFGGLASGLNNDCPAADAPAGVTSLTIEGTQTDGSGAITLCISRPDKLATQTLALGPDAVSSDVRLIDLGGSSNGCTFAQDTTRIPTGTVAAAGLCGNGSDAAGFELVVNGATSLTRTCGQTVDTVGVTLVGSVAVHPM